MILILYFINIIIDINQYATTEIMSSKLQQALYRQGPVCCVGYTSIEAFKCYYGSLLTPPISPIYSIIRENDKIFTL